MLAKRSVLSRIIDPLIKFVQSRGGAARDPENIIGVPAVQPRTVTDVTDTREFAGLDFDFDTMERALEGDSYVTQALERYRELMFKSGFRFKGSNPNAVHYIEMRLDLMAEASQMPTESLVMEIADDIVFYANAVVSKVRDRDYPFPPGITVTPLIERGPVVAYFPLNVTQMSVRRRKNGVIARWKQEVGDEERTWAAEDIVHIYYRRQKGEPFGRPFLLSAIADIRALRQAEEQVLRLIYRNLFPFLHARVGTEEVPARDTEISQIQNIIDSMELEGGLATSERVNLDPVAVDKIIDAYSYLQYFERRCFTALGVSEVLMGRAATASRASAENLSVEMRDRIKALQRIVSLGIDSGIIHELLLEGGFDPIVNPQDKVSFVFNEIDVDAKIKEENHIVYLYENNAITEDEMRTDLGRDPIEDAEREKLYINLVTLVAARAKAETEPEDKKNDEPDQKESLESAETLAACNLDQLKDQILEQLEQSKGPVDFAPRLQRVIQEAALSEEESALFGPYAEHIIGAAEETKKTPILVSTIESMFDLMHMQPPI